jgi:predicted dinucleotide-binding enzyme
MNFGFIGAGTVAQTIARHVLPLGHQVVLSNRGGPASLQEIAAGLGDGARAGTIQEAADQEIVVLAVMWSHVGEALSSVSDWAGRTLVDATNRFESIDPLTVGDISGPTSSELVADLAPGAKIVKAFNNIPMAWIGDFSATKPRTVLFISGDDDAAKEPLRRVIEEAGLGCIDLGSLAIGGRLQQVGGPLAGVNLTMSDKLRL